MPKTAFPFANCYGKIVRKKGLGGKTMTEKAYKTMGMTGIVGLVVGITVIVTSVVSGVILIISSAKLFKAKNTLTF